MGLHPADGTAGHAEGLGVAVVELVEVAPQFFLRGGRTAHSLPQQGRVGDDAPPHHDAGEVRELRFQCFQLGRGSDVAVVADGHPAVGQIVCKSGAVGLAPVELAHDPGVDGQLTDGAAVIEVEDGFELLRAGDAQPGLDRDGAFGLREDFVEKDFELREVAQHPGTLAFGGDSAGGAAEVEVDFGVAHLPQLADHPGGQCAVFGQQLGDDRCAGVRCRVQLCHLLFDKHPVLGRGDEGGIIAGRRAGRPEPALVRLTPDSVGEALHGGGVVVHVSSPLSV